MGMAGKKTCLWGVNLLNGKNGTLKPPGLGTTRFSLLHDGLRKLVADLNHLYKSHPTWENTTTNLINLNGSTAMMRKTDPFFLIW